MEEIKFTRLHRLNQFTLIFILPPSLETLEERLKNRRTEKPEILQRRIENARKELKEKDKFDYAIINDAIDRAYGELKRIVSTERK